MWIFAKKLRTTLSSFVRFPFGLFTNQAGMLLITEGYICLQCLFMSLSLSIGPKEWTPIASAATDTTTFQTGRQEVVGGDRSRF